MIADKFALDKYIIKRGALARYLISSANKEPLLYGVKKIGKNQIAVYDSPSSSVAALKIEWKVKRGIFANKYTYRVIDKAHNPVATIESERSVVFTASFILKDSFGREAGVIQPDQVGYIYRFFNIVVGDKNLAAFYRNAYVSMSYVLDLSGDRDKVLDRKIALSVALIIASTRIQMQKFNGPIDWQRPIAVGNEAYKIKRG